MNISTKKWLFLILFGIVTTSINSQHNSGNSIPWYVSKYQVNTLENMGIERLKTEKELFLSKRNNGMVLAGMGFILSTIGVSNSVKNISPNSSSSSALGIAAFLGIGALIGGTSIWITNGHRHNQINKAIQNLNMKVSELNYNHKDTSIYQFGITVNF